MTRRTSTRTEGARFWRSRRTSAWRGPRSLISSAAACMCLLSPACQDDVDDDDDGDGDDDGGAVFAEAVDGLAHGVALGAWSSGSDLLVAGGRLSAKPGDEYGSPGVVVRITPEGKACRALEADRTLWWIHGAEGPGADPDNWYAVGEGGLIVHHLPGGASVDESVVSDAILYGVWAGEDQILAVGGDPFGPNSGEVWRRDPGSEAEQGSWSLVAGDLPGVAFKVWDHWIVGDGVAWRLDGDTLVEHHPPGGERLTTVRGRSDDDVYAVGGFSGPVLLHWDGASWSEMTIDVACVSGGLNGVWTAPGEDLWIGGFFGGAARFDGERWSCSAEPLTFEHYHAVWRHQGETWWVGGNLLKAGGSALSLAWTGGEPPSSVLDSCD